MDTYNIHDAKTHFSRLVEAVAERGEEILIAKAGKPVAKLVPVSATSGPRVLGTLAGSVRESPDCWETDPGLEALFYGSKAGAWKPKRVAEPKRRR